MMNMKGKAYRTSPHTEEELKEMYKEKCWKDFL
jgi:hypothetical protein